MRKFQKIICLVLVVVFALAVAGCGGSANKGIEGKWKFAGGESEMAEDMAHYINLSGGKLTFEFDKTGLSEEEKANIELMESLMGMMEIKYEVVSDTELKLTMSAFGESQEETMEYKLDGDKLTFAGAEYTRA